MTKSERWILSEWRVARDRVERLGEELLAHRERTPFAEIDLLFDSGSRSGTRDGDLLTLVEVKSWSHEIWGPDLISRRQVRRLERARFFLQEKHRRPVRLLLAVVSDSGIRYFDGLAGY